MSEDKIHHPTHYISVAGLECIDVIDAFKLSYEEGNILKYLLRWKKKNGVEDLRKAMWYLERIIDNQTLAPK